MQNRGSPVRFCFEIYIFKKKQTNQAKSSPFFFIVAMQRRRMCDGREDF
jgi:hypothetical protein